MPLSGWQLSFLLEVPVYELENPPRPGELVLTSSGTAVVTRTERAGLETIYWADYGSGIEQPHGAEGLLGCAAKTVLGGEEVQAIASPDEGAAADPLALISTKACGWIGEKVTQRSRKNRDPWTCRQHWLYWEEPGGKKRSRYIPKAKLELAWESVYELKRSIYQTLELLGK